MQNHAQRGSDRSRDVFDVLEHLDFEREPWRRRRIDVRAILDACLPPQGHPGLSSADARRTMTQVVWHSSDVASGSRLRSGPTLAMAVKVAFAIDDVLAGRWHLVPSEGFARLLEDLGLPVAPDRPRLPVADPVTPSLEAYHGMVEFAHPWRPNPLGTRQRLGTATALAYVTEVDRVDAPVACSLWTPHGRLDVRRHGATWLRPVLSPGSWEPITSDRFRAAAASGVAWRDSPFLPHTGRNRPTFHLSDYASPRPLAKGDEARVAEARDACLARAGSLCTIDGIVHRTTQEPLAGMAIMLVDGEVQVVPAWSLGSLDSMCSMDTLECSEGVDTACLRAGMGVTSGVGRGLVPAADWAAAVDLLPAGWPFDDGGRVAGRPSGVDLVRRGHGQVCARDGRTAFDAAIALSRQALRHSWTWARTRGMHHDLREWIENLEHLNRSEVGPELRRRVSARMGPLCDRLSESLRGSAEPTGPLWEFVAALAAHAVDRDVVEGVDDDLAGVRL